MNVVEERTEASMLDSEYTKSNVDHRLSILSDGKRQVKLCLVEIHCGYDLPKEFSDEIYSLCKSQDLSVVIQFIHFTTKSLCLHKYPGLPTSFLHFHL